MAEIIPFRKPKPSEKFRGNTSADAGFHKWAVTNEKPFDVKQGKLVTVYRCQRCRCDQDAGDLNEPG